MTGKYDILQNRLLALIRLAVCESSVEPALFEGMTPSDWQVLMNYASSQGVMALCFSAFESASIRPPMDELMDWLGQTEYIKTCYDSQLESALNLVTLLKEATIDTLVLKGLSLSYLYPSKKVREFSDLDVYVFGKHNEAVELVQSKGIKVEEEDKHDVFNFENTHVELHSHFLNPLRKTNRLLNAYLEQVSVKEKCTLPEFGWYCPNPDFNAVFLLRHMCVHLATEGMTLRNVLDYALLFLKEGDNIHWDEVKPVLKEAKMNIAFDTMVAVCEKVLYVDFSLYYMGKPNLNLADRVMDEVMNVHLHAESGYDTGKRVWKKTQRLFSRKWMYDSGLLPDKFWTEVIWGSVRDHIKNPKYW